MGGAVRAELFREGAAHGVRYARTTSPHEIERIKKSVNLVELVGRTVKLVRDGAEFKGLCPFHAETTGSLAVNPKKGLFHCFGCGESGDAIAWVQKTDHVSFPEALRRLGANETGRGGAALPLPLETPPAVDPGEEAERAKRVAAAKKIWEESLPATGTLVATYLAARGLAGVKIPPTVRFHPRLWSAEAARTLPGVVGAVFCRNALVGVHRTFLRPDGSGKADLKSPKKMLGSCQGGHVWCSPARVEKRLIVAEGIETSLSVAKAVPNVPVWAALSLGNMGADVPESVADLVLCADGDNKDPAAADRVLAHAEEKHRRPWRVVRVARPDVGKDFNDMVRGV